MVQFKIQIPNKPYKAPLIMINYKDSLVIIELLLIYSNSKIWKMANKFKNKQDKIINPANFNKPIFLPYKTWNIISQEN